MSHKSNAPKNAAAAGMMSGEIPDNDAIKRSRPLPVRIAGHFRSYWQLWLMFIPATVFVFIFHYIPLYGLQLAFRKNSRSGGFDGDWVGFKYFEQFFSSPNFVQTLTNTVRISLWSLVMGFFAPIILALLLNQLAGKKIKGFIQTITYMPHFISMVVIVTMLTIFLDPKSGFIGRVAGPDNLLNIEAWFTPLYWLSGIWQGMGWGSIIYLAALSGVDTSLYEAAKMDGASRLQLIRYVDIPTILPTSIILLIMDMGKVLNVGFEKVYLMQNPFNMQVSEVISTYTYKIGILSSQFSYATAIGLFNTVINLCFVLAANWIARRASDVSIF